MFIKKSFCISKCKKPTEKSVARVLISSICCIIFCLFSLIGTTWAWFYTTIENTDNIIEIATVTEQVIITDSEDSAITPEDGVYYLDPGTYTVKVSLESIASAYVLIKAVQNEEINYYYLAFTDNDEIEKTIENKFYINNSPAQLSFSVSWVKPESATELGNDDNVTIGESTAENTVTDDQSDTKNESTPQQSDINVTSEILP